MSEISKLLNVIYKNEHLTGVSEFLNATTYYKTTKFKKKDSK